MNYGKNIACLNKTLKILINYLFGPLLFIILSWSLYSQISRQPDLSLRWHQIMNSWLNWKFWLVIILMLVNWGIETKKWQLLIHHVQEFSFYILLPQKS